MSATSIDTRTAPDDAILMQRIEAEYVEMPGLRLTEKQAARLWGLDVTESAQLLSALIEAGFLTRDPTGAYRRRGCPRCA